MMHVIVRVIRLTKVQFRRFYHWQSMCCTVHHIISQYGSSSAIHYLCFLEYLLVVKMRRLHISVKQYFATVRWGT